MSSGNFSGPNSGGRNQFVRNQIGCVVFNLCEMMKVRSLVDVAAFTSGFLAIGVFILWTASPSYDVTKIHLKAPRNSYIGVDKIDGSEYLIAFNNVQYGPPICVIMGINGSESSDWSETFWKSAGIFYRCISRRGRGESWVFGINLLYIVLLLAIVPAFWFFRRNRAVVRRIRGK